MRLFRGLPALLFASLLATACGGVEQAVTYDFPQLELSTETIEFGSEELGGRTTRTVWLSNPGDLPMGIGAIELGTSDRSDPNFSRDWSLDEIECPLGGGVPEPSQDAAAVLDSGCRLPVRLSFEPEELGTLWGSLLVSTASDEGVLAFHADPIHARRIVYLVGDGEQAVADIAVQPRRHDYGHLWTGTAEAAYVTIRNEGNGVLTVTEPSLDGCAEGFEITALGTEGAFFALEPGAATYVEITYTPPSTAAASCSLIIESDDADTPWVEVDLRANTGTDPDNTPPTVAIRSPSIGHRWSGGEEDTLELQVEIFDLDQPADTLTCRVKSMARADGITVAHCDANDASGMVYVDVPYRYVDRGIDTLRVQVSDAPGVLSFASTTVLWNDVFPGSDDDGDGWGEAVDADEDGDFDCDDLDPDSYPYAAELADGRDNDCDGVIDEGTAVYDDDGDAFDEEAGDCDDNDEEVYPGNREVADYKDNDCDGLIDEGTSLFDDDGDGYTEMDGDCHDEAEGVHPGAVEYCDGIDNDCDGLRDQDDDCLELSSTPYVVGAIKLQQTACEPGDTVEVSVLAYDADGQDLDYAWGGDEELIIEPLTGSATVTVTCPEPTSGDGEVFSLHVTVSDEDGTTVWAFSRIGVYPAGELYRPFTEYNPAQGSCSSGAASPALSLAWLALVGAALRRRREWESR